MFQNCKKYARATKQMTSYGPTKFFSALNNMFNLSNDSVVSFQ